MEKVLDLQEYLSNGNVLLRENEIPPRNEDNNLTLSRMVSEDFVENSSDNYAPEAVMQICSQSQSFLDNDSDFRKENGIQEFQRSLRVLNQSSNNKYQRMSGLCNELHRVTEMNEDWHDQGCSMVADAISHFVKLHVTQNAKQGGDKTRERLHFPENGQYMKQKEKRKKTMGK